MIILADGHTSAPPQRQCAKTVMGSIGFSSRRILLYKPCTMSCYLLLGYINSNNILLLSYSRRYSYTRYRLRDHDNRFVWKLLTHHRYLNFKQIKSYIFQTLFTYQYIPHTINFLCRGNVAKTIIYNLYQRALYYENYF